LKSNGHIPPTQQAILNVLMDGRAHTREELHGCLPDELQEEQNVRVHICYLRPGLRLKGMDIICEGQGTKRVCYRLIRHISMD